MPPLSIANISTNVDNLFSKFSGVEKRSSAEYSKPTCSPSPPFSKPSIRSTRVVENAVIFSKCGSVIGGKHRLIISTEDSSRAYIMTKVLCKAIYGRVCLAEILSWDIETEKWQLSGERCAIKELELSLIERNSSLLFQKSQEDPMKEIAAMQHFRDIYFDDDSIENVLVPIEVMSSPAHILIILPFCSGGELFDLVDKSQGEFGFEETTAKLLMKQILQGVKSLHDAGICHRDLSLENVMLHENKCKIIDFGMSVRMPTKQNALSRPRSFKRKLSLIEPTGPCGKLFYMSPEIFRNQAYDGRAVDIWSAGAIMFMLIVGSPAYSKPDISDDCFKWIVSGRMSKLLSDWGMNVSDEAINLMEEMMCVDPSRRLTIDQIEKHPWFRDVQ